MSSKPRVSLTILPSRTGIFGYGPLDRDLAAQDGSGLDLIWRVDSGSGGHGRLGCGRRRVLAGALLPRRRSAAESPEMAALVFQGSKSSGLGSGRIYASCVIHPWPLLGSGWSVAEGAPATAGQRGGGSPARAFWATPGATGYGKMAQKGAGDQGVLT